MTKSSALYPSAGVGLLLVVFAVALQLQHLVCSTARLKNESSQLLSDVLVRVGDAVVPVGDLSPGRSKFVWLPRGGEATFSVEFSSAGQKHRDCSEYVEGEMYHVRATVSSALTLSCSAELGLFSRIMVLELW
jgi:hypothetical protein